MDSEEDRLDSQEEDFGDTSSSSAEEWNEEESNGSFDMSIVGEEIRNGRLRHEVFWWNWTRRDGTSNTWRPNEEGVDEETLEDWNDRLAAKRERLASESLDIEIWSDLNVVNTNTQLRAQAYDEKRRKRYQKPVSLFERTRENLEKHGRAPPANPARQTNVVSRRSRVIVESRSSRPSNASAGRDSAEPGPSTSRPRRPPPNLRRSRSRTLTRTPSPEPMSVDEEYEDDRMSVSPPPTSYKGKGKERAVVPPEVGTSRTSSKGKGKCPVPQATRVRSAGDSRTQQSARVIAPLPSRAQSGAGSSKNRSNLRNSQRDTLAAEWTTAARRAGAAPVTFVNEVDTEEIPALVPGFVYLEAELDFSAISFNFPEEGFFSRCEDEDCTTAQDCSCGQESEHLAYDEYGRFIGNNKDESPPFVMECNQYCACDPERCSNRVAQHPRTVPIEVFKTRRCGWGVRSTIDIQKGTVLGLYTGKIIYRDEAELLKKSYCFDLDGLEDPEDPPEEAYTVDASAAGNWTRFLNHSCSANLKVYLAFWDTLPQNNLPFLVYYAAKDIPARREFTFDYDPRQARLHQLEKGKKKGKKSRAKSTIPEGAIACECGTSSCRGWVTVNC